MKINNALKKGSKNEITPLLSKEKLNNANMSISIMIIVIGIPLGLLLGFLVAFLADRSNENRAGLGMAAVGAGAAVLGVAGALTCNRLRLFYNHKKLINNNQHITADLNPVAPNNL